MGCAFADERRQDACYARAQNAYHYDAQREAQFHARGEQIAGALVSCGMRRSDEAFGLRNYCAAALDGELGPAPYGRCLCLERATTCDELQACPY